VWLVSTITDSGIGIRPEDIDKLFKDYNQVDVKDNHAIEGTGLGLAITKNLVHLMDGAVDVESIYGVGSTFRVRLRQGFVNDTPIGAEVAQNLRKFKYFDEKHTRSEKLIRIRLPYARVLVVDDVPVNLDVVRGMMQPYQMQIDCVTSGEEAIELVRDEEVHYNAIFMDHMMPGMDGIETVRIIREEIGTDYAKSVPIIALTANAIAGNEEMFLGKGFQAFLSKPIDIQRMDQVIRKWVRDRELEKELEAERQSRTFERDGKQLVDQRAGSERRKRGDRRIGGQRRNEDDRRRRADGAL
jgi:CheY-like chemotaxis protein